MSTDTSHGYIPEVTVGWRIRIARETAGLDQAALAAATGIARNTISNYELGATKHVKGIYLRAIALATGVDARWLETGQAGPTNGPGLTVVAGTGFEPVTSGSRVGMRMSNLATAA